MEVENMKRVQAACILQTLVFSQKPEMGFSREHAERLNRAEFESYKHTMERSHTRYQIVGEDVREDGALIVHVRKQYNEKAAVDEYFI